MGNLFSDNVEKFGRLVQAVESLRLEGDKQTLETIAPWLANRLNPLATAVQVNEAEAERLLANVGPATAHGAQWSYVVSGWEFLRQALGDLAWWAQYLSGARPDIPPGDVTPLSLITQARGSVNSFLRYRDATPSETSFWGFVEDVEREVKKQLPTTKDSIIFIVVILSLAGLAWVLNK